MARLIVSVLTANSACVELAAATVTTHSPVMGPNLLSANQLARWYNSVRHGIPPKVPSLHNRVTALAQTFINEGRRDGVRGDIAFVQSILETGWFSYQGSQIPPDANNFAGINAFDGRKGLKTCAHGDRSPSRCFPSATIGVRTQIQLLRSYADATTNLLNQVNIASIPAGTQNALLSSLQAAIASSSRKFASSRGRAVCCPALSHSASSDL